MANSNPKPPNAGMGRPKGVPNKTTALLKDAILQAATLAGGKDGLIGYLTIQAQENPGPFMSLLGKVMPLQITGDPSNPVAVRHMTDAELLAIAASGAGVDETAESSRRSH